MHNKEVERIFQVKDKITSNGKIIRIFKKFFKNIQRNKRFIKRKWNTIVIFLRKKLKINSNLIDTKTNPRWFDKIHKWK